MMTYSEAAKIRDLYTSIYCDRHDLSWWPYIKAIGEPQRVPRAGAVQRALTALRAAAGIEHRMAEYYVPVQVHKQPPTSLYPKDTRFPRMYRGVEFRYEPASSSFSSLSVLPITLYSENDAA